MSVQRRHGQSIHYAVAGPLQRCWGIWGCGPHGSPVGQLWAMARALLPSSWWPSQPFGQQQLLRTDASNIFHFFSHTLSHFFIHHPSPITEKNREGLRKSSWLELKADFHTLSYIWMASERSCLKKDKAAGPGCAQPTYEHDGWLGARTFQYIIYITTVLAKTVDIAWGSGAFVPHAKSPQHLNFQFPLFQILQVRTKTIETVWNCCIFWIFAGKTLEIKVVLEACRSQVWDGGALSSSFWLAGSWAPPFPSLWLVSARQTSIREPTWLDPLSNLHRHSTLQGRMCVVALRPVLVFWALLVQIVLSPCRCMDAEWPRMTQILGID